MKFKELIHWHEGLFLLPHHLQGLQRSFQSYLVAERQILNPYPYGIIDMELSEEGLENLIIKPVRLTAVMPSGNFINMPANTQVPSINLKDVFEERREMITVYLALPLWSETGGNSIETYEEQGNDNRRIFKVVEQEWVDENSGDNPKTIQTRQLNARLLLDGEDSSDMELLPLLQIAPASDESSASPVRVNRKFIPPCMHLEASQEFYNMVADLLNDMKLARDEQVVQLNRTGYNPELLSGVQLERVLLLRSLNCYCARIDAIMKTPIISPFSIYMELRSLLGELAATQPARDLYHVPDYDHDNCKPVFIEIVKRIRSLISPEGSGSYIKIDFAKNEAATGWLAELTDEHLMKAEDYFIAVQVQENAQKVISQIEGGDQFKLIAASQMGGRVRGVRLKEERYPPNILPAIPNVLWFRLLRSESQRSWSQIRDEKQVAAVWSDTLFPRMEVTLFITIFEDGAN